MTFDELTFNKKCKQFETTIHHGGKQFGLTIHDLSESQITSASKLTDEIGNYITSNTDKVKKFAATKLTSIFNEYYSEGDEITEQDFIDAIELSFVTSDFQRNFRVYFESELFEGDFTAVDINAGYEMINAEVER